MAAQLFVTADDTVEFRCDNRRRCLANVGGIAGISDKWFDRIRGAADLFEGVRPAARK
jgi:hypothetical protein